MQAGVPMGGGGGFPGGGGGFPGGGGGFGGGGFNGLPSNMAAAQLARAKYLKAFRM